LNVVRPLEFASAFQAVVKLRSKEINAFWKPWSAKEYTRLFLQRDDSILKDVARRLKLDYAQPWCTLDAIFFEHARAGLAEYLSVAIEHENFSRRAAYQVNKLSIFNAPLKVLITYPAGPSLKDESKQDAVLRLCSEMLRAADALGDFSHARQQMIILGSDDPEDDGGVLTWRHFLDEHGAFVQLHI
jgi:hypothetical protein